MKRLCGAFLVTLLGWVSSAPAQQTTFPAFLAGAPSAAGPYTSIDLLPLVRSGTTYKLPITALMVSGQATASELAGLGTGVATALSVNVGSTGAFVVNGGALGTPSSGTLSNATGLPIGTGVSGLGAGVATWLATPSSANLAGAVTDETGSGLLVFATSPVLTTPSLGVATATTINKVALTAPATSATLTIADGKTLTDTSGIGASVLLGATGGGFTAYAGTSCTNQFVRSLSSAAAATCASVAISTDVSGLAAGVATWLTTPSSANLRSALTDETGTGFAYFQGGDLGTPSAGVLTNATGLPVSTGVSGLGTGVVTALGVNVGSAGAFVTFNGALGTPSSGALTNATGLPIASGVSGLGAGVATFLATPSSANLASAVTDETGSGGLVFATSPTIDAANLTTQPKASTSNATTGINGAGAIFLTQNTDGTDLNWVRGYSFRNAANEQIASIFAQAISQANNSGDLVLATRVSGGANALERVRVTSTGFLGIGQNFATNAPQAILHVSNGTNATTGRIYNTFTDALNGEWSYLGSWGPTANVSTFGTDRNGTGTARAVNIVSATAGGSSATAIAINITQQVAFPVSTMLGSATPLTLTTGEAGFAKIAASGSAPGAAGAKEAWVCGTNAGSAKKIAYAGTSTTPVTIIDNVGSGVTGC